MIKQSVLDCGSYTGIFRGNFQTSVESLQNVDPAAEDTEKAKPVMDKGSQKKELNKEDHSLEEKKDEEKPLDKPMEEGLNHSTTL